MSEVQRWQVWVDEIDGILHSPSRGGEYVRYEDHIAALAAKDALLRRAVGLLEDATHYGTADTHGEQTLVRWEVARDALLTDAQAQGLEEE